MTAPVARARPSRVRARVLAAGALATSAAVVATLAGVLGGAPPAASTAPPTAPLSAPLSAPLTASAAAASSTGSGPATARASVDPVVRGTRYRPTGPVAAPPRVRLRAWAVADLDTGAILAVHRARAFLPQASTIKLLTAVTAAATVAPRPAHRVSYAEAHPASCTCAGLLVGRRYSRAALLTGMLLPSGNDAAEALAGSHPQGRAAFVRAMNDRAAALGATDTHVVTPSGLSAAGAGSSARDLLVFLRAAQADAVVEPFLEMRSGEVGPLHGRSHPVYRGTEYVNTYAGSQGKSGYTTPAGNTLVVSTVIRGHRIGVATLGAPHGRSTRDTRALTVWAAVAHAHLAALGRLPDAPGPPVGAQAAARRTR